MSRIERINELLRDELSVLVSKEINVDDCLVTISYVKCSPDLRHAKIGVRSLPEHKLGTVLRELRKHNMSFARTLNKRLKLKYMPHFRWVADVSGRNFDRIEEILRKIKEEESYEQDN